MTKPFDLNDPRPIWEQGLSAGVSPSSSGTEEVIAELQYEAGMYKSLYEHIVSVIAKKPLSPCTQAELDAWEKHLDHKDAQLLVMWVDRALKAEAALTGVAQGQSACGEIVGWQARDKVRGGVWLHVPAPRNNPDFEYRPLYTSPLAQTRPMTVQREAIDDVVRRLREGASDLCCPECCYENTMNEAVDIILALVSSPTTQISGDRGPAQQPTIPVTREAAEPTQYLIDRFREHGAKPVAQAAPDPSLQKMQLSTRNAVIEECARVADRWGDGEATMAAAEIRMLKTSPVPSTPTDRNLAESRCEDCPVPRCIVCPVTSTDRDTKA